MSTIGTGTDHATNHPKRLDEETVAYLLQIESEWDNSRDDEMINVLVENVLDEIRTKTASAACDRHTHAVIEKICQATPLKMLVEIFERFSPYAVFLSRNRHSSHVMQTAFARLGYLLKVQGIQDLDEDRIVDSVLSVATPILEEVNWLAVDMSASHVLRSILCALSGIPLVSERKGKTARHQHSSPFSEPLECLMEEGRFFISRYRLYFRPSKYQSRLTYYNLVKFHVQECVVLCTHKISRVPCPKNRKFAHPRVWENTISRTCQFYGEVKACARATGDCC
jgi:hypothetical protein